MQKLRTPSFVYHLSLTAREIAPQLSGLWQAVLVFTGLAYVASILGITQVVSRMQDAGQSYGLILFAAVFTATILGGFVAHKAHQSYLQVGEKRVQSKVKLVAAILADSGHDLNDTQIAALLTDGKYILEENNYGEILRTAYNLEETGSQGAMTLYVSDLPAKALNGNHQRW
jgi:hypothetical protein